MSLRNLVTCFAILVSAVLTAAGQTSRPAPKIPVQEIIQKFAAAESQNKIARNNYTFTQDFDVKTIGEAGSVTGQFRRVSDIVYDDRSQRIEKITFFPPSTLKGLGISNEDMQDLAGVQPFALTLEDLPKYQIDYAGTERIDEIDTYVFEVKPKAFVKGERYFQGRVWVEDRDLQVVKAAGQAVPEVAGQKFPHFESYRENIDERFWFPTYVYADDVLEFKSGPVHMKMVVKFTNYKKFTSFVTLVDAPVEVHDEEKSKPGQKEQEKKPVEPPKPIKPPNDR
ncbi:MAG TPA: hypothetical protein VFV34_04900 [Blastocatellia bacterium]|nr:hypothetical protein [Blastocatellia bacterium]